ncbi:MAG: formate dehydrogenase accessory protein FdhE, partial [Syntrophaceae bacterium]|nr:formate dehydrogenase accessory protein FdhE [Syntrophaceae bacterium]
MATNEISEIENIIERAYEQYPHSSSILKAFAPIIIRQRQLAALPSSRNLDCSLIDREKLKAGVPVARQIDLFLPEDSLKDVTLSIAAGIKEGMPQLAESVDLITDLIEKEKINPADYFQAPAEGGSNPADSWTKDLKVSPSNASFLMSLVSRVVLERRNKEITAALGEFEWEKGYCPICGTFPSIALIEEQGGKRFLHCSACGHYWRFTRIICPHCENEAAKGMDYFYVENKTQESAFICDKCKKYLVTLYRAGSLFARDMDVSAISLIHLDM